MKKKILIVGANSYIGTYFKKWLQKKEKEVIIDVISSRNGAWAQKNFGLYDVIFYVAGIAHVNAKKSMKDTYYRVNRDLTLQVARKAKSDGVKQFIFMSSIIVYGENNKKNRTIIITKSTIPKPLGVYGDSKLQAEQGLLKLQNEKFKVVIVRPPMIYGKECRGNYNRLKKLAKIVPLFPKIKNQKSMLYIENLCEFLRLVIKKEEQGIFFPQNKEYVNTTDLVKQIGNIYNKHILDFGGMNFIISFMEKHINIVNKVFGTMVYQKDMSEYENFSYCIADFKQSIKETER